MSTTWVKVSYAVLLGLVLAISAGFGVLIFETGPQPPQPLGLSFSALNGNANDQQQSRISKQIDSFYNDNQSYREKFPDHQRNIFLWFAGIGLITGVVGVALPRVVNYLRLGFLLGGFLLVVAGTWYALQGLPQGAPPASSLLALFSSGTPKQLDTAGRFLRFAVSIVGLLVLLFVGLWRLTDWPAPAAEKQPLPGTAMAGYAPVAPTAQSPSLDTPVSAASPYASRSSDDTVKWARPEERRPLATEPEVGGAATQPVTPPANVNADEEHRGGAG